MELIIENETFKTKLTELAKAYARGLAEPDSDSEALQVFVQAESSNDPEILFALASCYQFGWSVEINIEKAAEYYIKVADTAAPKALSQIKTCNEYNIFGMMQSAFEHFKRRANDGDAIAQFNVGYCYEYGIGVAKNQELAAKAFQQAKQMLQETSSSGDDRAMLLLGWMAENGQGTGESKAQMFELYKRAAEAGNAEAQAQLARCYYDGIGVAKDYAQAVLWYEKAAKQGHADAALNLAIFYYNGEVVEENQTMAFDYFKQAAIAGNGNAQFYIVRYYHEGIIVPQSYPRVAYWLEKSASQRNQLEQQESSYYRDAAYHKLLNKIYSRISISFAMETWEHSPNSRKQQMLKLRRKTVFLLARLASAGGCEKAFVLVGDCFFDGLGVEKNFEAAGLNYVRGKADTVAALMRLAKCYQTGETAGNEVDEFSALQRANFALRAQINATMERML